MTKLPDGTLTFVAVAGDSDFAVEREQIEHCGGLIFPSNYDHLYAAFPTAHGAVAAAIAIQRDAPTPLTIAAHTGIAERRNTLYSGATLVRLRHILSAAHPGQILVSLATHQTFYTAAAPDVHLRELGAYRLRDMGKPVALFQVVASGLREDFPPPRSIGKTHPGLPVAPTPLIGRERELDTALARLRDARVLTLTGPGGIGKSTLAVQVALEAAETITPDIRFVDLAPVRDPDGVVSAIAHALRITAASATDTDSLRTAIGRFIGNSAITLVLDNFEQVVAGAAHVGWLVQTCPGLRCIVTSRQRLGLADIEAEFKLSPLDLPDMRELPPPGALLNWSAIALFVERARAVRPDFCLTLDNAPIIADICVALDGLPLAIELAAARSRTFAPPALRARLFNLLSDGSGSRVARHSSIDAAIEWSYTLLSPVEQRILRIFGGFVGSCSLAALTNVCATCDISEPALLDYLDALIAANLVFHVETADTEPRFNMLETIRHFARHQLEQEDDAALIHRAHAEHYLNVAEEAAVHLATVDHTRWVAGVEAAHANIQSALYWAHEQHEAEIMVRMCGALWRFWYGSSYQLDGSRWHTLALAVGDSMRNAPYATILKSAGSFAQAQGDYARAENLYQNSLRLWEELRDKKGRADVLNNLGLLAGKQGDLARAKSFFEKCLVLREQINDLRSLSVTYTNFGNWQLYQKDALAALDLYHKSLALDMQYNDDKDIATDRFNIGRAAADLGRLTVARDALAESLTLCRALTDDWGIADCLGEWAMLYIRQNQPEQACELFGVEEALRERANTPLSPIEQARYAPHLSTLTTQMSPESFRRAWARGRGRAVDEVIVGLLQQNAPAAPRIVHDPYTDVFAIDGCALDLTPNQLRLFGLLFVRRGMLVSNAIIVDKVWADTLHAPQPNDILNLVREVRAKVDAVARPNITGKSLIVTVRGQGYTMTADDPPL